MSWKATDASGVRVRRGKDGRRQYLARWRDHGGRQVSATFERKKDAVAAREQARAEVRRVRAGQLAPPPDAAHSFDSLCDHWLSVKAGKRSIKDDQSMIRKYLQPALGRLELTSITKAVVDGFYLERLRDIEAGRLAPKTARNIMTLLGSMLNEAWRQDWIGRVPHVEKPKLDEQSYCWITTEQVLVLLEAARADPLHPQLEPILAVAAYTGLRAGEVLGLKWSDVDFERRLITAQRSYGKPYTKTGTVKRVPLLAVLVPILLAWREASSGAGWLFPTRQGQVRQPGDRHLSQHFQRALAAGGLAGVQVQGGGGKRFTFHDLRHSFASNWMASGGDIFKLQRILGHRSITTTMRYAHLAPRAFEADYGRFGGAVEA